MKPLHVCTQTLQVCNKTQVTDFRVVAKNEERGQPEASYVRSVKVFLPHDTEVELQKGRRVLVGGPIEGGPRKPAAAVKADRCILRV